LKDAVNVLIRNLSDFQLAVAIARVVEGRDDGPILLDVLSNTVVPKAFKEGNRWLASWAFWLLHRRDLAVRVLVVSRVSPPSWLRSSPETDTTFHTGQYVGLVAAKHWRSALRRPEPGTSILSAEDEDPADGERD
jgi:hypothetical protein